MTTTLGWSLIQCVEIQSNLTPFCCTMLNLFPSQRPLSTSWLWKRSNFHSIDPTCRCYAVCIWMRSELRCWILNPSEENANIKKLLLSFSFQRNFLAACSLDITIRGILNQDDICKFCQFSTKLKFTFTFFLKGRWNFLGKHNLENIF